MPSKKRSSKRRHSQSARKGWVTRRRNAYREFLRRSRASKKGWRRRKAKAKIIAEARAQPKTKRGALREWLVTWIYKPMDNPGPPRQVDFTVIARSKSDAELFVVTAFENGQDSEGTDLSWMQKIPWNEIFSVPVEEQNATLSKDEIKALGEGYVTIN